MAVEETTKPDPIRHKVIDGRWLFQLKPAFMPNDPRMDFDFEVYGWGDAWGLSFSWLYRSPESFHAALEPGDVKHGLYTDGEGRFTCKPDADGHRQVGFIRVPARTAKLASDPDFIVEDIESQLSWWHVYDDDKVYDVHLYELRNGSWIESRASDASWELYSTEDSDLDGAADEVVAHLEPEQRAGLSREELAQVPWTAGWHEGA